MTEAIPSNRFSWGVVGKWFLANFFGSIAGAIILFSIAYVMSGGFGSPAYMDSNAEPEKVRLFKNVLLPLFFMGGLFGLILAICQALAMTAYLRNLSAWIFFTAIGFGIGTMSEFFPGNIHFSWVLTFTLVGIFQWILLRTQVQKSWLWIIVNFALGAGIEILGGWILGVIAYLFVPIGSIVTGIALAWLIAHPLKL